MRRIVLVALALVSALCVQVLAQAAPDPIRIATGARPLGMGKAFAGLADDVGSVFLNPAGLANANRWQMTSMSGKLLDEFSYLSLSGLYPTSYGNVGIAYVGSSIGGAIPTTIETSSDPADPIYVADGSDPMSYSNNLFLLSYGSKLERLLSLPLLSAVGSRFPRLKDINFGANLKLFTVYLAGDHISNGSANGTEVDLGLQGKPLSWLSLGGNLQNALPVGMGGKLHYATGWEESYPAVLKLGAAADIIGPMNALRAIGNHKVKLLTDLDYEVSRSSNIPALWHVGLEWKPVDLIAVRAGIDQEMVGVRQATNNLTGGVGVYYGDFRFDYAYHQFTGAPGIDNHFFSLSYGITPGAAMREKLLSSPDRLITTNMVEKVEGTAVDPEIVTVRVNGVKVKLSPKGEFLTEVSLKVGKNSIRVEGFDTAGKLVEADKLRILRLITYPDVNQRHWAFEQTGYIGTLGIIQGYPDGGFKPEGNITRAELSALLIRTLVTGDANVPSAKEETFPDVKLSHWAAKYVNLAAGKGIVKGYPDGSFKPSANITRAEGLAMIARFGSVKELPYAGKEFTDVNVRHWAAPIIAGAFKEGMLIHFKDRPFEPGLKLTRAEAVEMLFRSRPVTGLVNDLKDFEKGY